MASTVDWLYTIGVQAGVKTAKKINKIKTVEIKPCKKV